MIAPLNFGGTRPWLRVFEPGPDWVDDSPAPLPIDDGAGLQVHVRIPTGAQVAYWPMPGPWRRA